MAEPGLDIDLRLGRQRQTRQQLPGNLQQLGAVGPVVMPPTAGSQSVAVVGSIVSGPKQQTMGHDNKPVAHYLSKGKGRDGTESLLFGKPGQSVDPARFAQAVQTDPRQFRFSVNPPRNAPYFPLQAYTEVLMARVEKDLGRPLDWIAAVHHDTQHPHVHVVLRGKDLDNKDLYINKDYLRRGLRARASQIATWLLGPEKGLDRTIAQTHEPRKQQTVRRSLGHAKEQRHGQEMGL